MTRMIIDISDSDELQHRFDKRKVPAEGELPGHHCSVETIHVVHRSPARIEDEIEIAAQDRHHLADTHEARRRNAERSDGDSIDG